jgi:kinesin family member 1
MLAGVGGGEGVGGGLGSESERAKIRAEMEAEREAQMAAMREELAAKLRQELEEGKTWDERVAETKLRAEARDRELAEMGMLTGEAREAALEKAKTTPHLTNLHEDQLMTEQVIFLLAPGTALTVGRKDAETPKDVRLGGIGVAKDHAIIRAAEDGSLTVEPQTPGAKVFVNGDPITGPTPLHHLHRIVFGTGHVYKVIVPAEAAAGRPPDGEDVPPAIDHTFALNELNRAQIKAMAVEEARRQAEAEAERKRADARIQVGQGEGQGETEGQEREGAHASR